jgi:hypothetical protein
MIPTDELLADEAILGGLDVMVDDHIGFLKTRIAFLEAYADWIDIMRANEDEYELDLDNHPSALLKAMGRGEHAEQAFMHLNAKSP